MKVQNKFEGLVEVCQDEKWKTICNVGWDNNEARVVCRQLGFAEDIRGDSIATSYWLFYINFICHKLITANRVTNARWRFNLAPRSHDQEIITVVWGCSGSELQLLSQCPQTSSSRSSCTETGVYCYGM